MSGDRRPSDAELEARLVDVARHLDFPPTPDLAPAIAAHLRARSPATRPRRALGPRRAVAFAAVVAVAVAAGVVGLSPGARRAVAGWFGLPGVRIEVGARPRAPLGGDLNLGTEATLSEAEAAVGFDVAVPDPGLVGAPDGVFLAHDPPGGRVTLVYDGRARAVGLLVTQFRAAITDELISKSVEPGTVEPLSIRGERAYWISDAHVVLFVGPTGESIEETIRLAGPTLVWQRDDVTVRLEGATDVRTALRIARSVR